MSVWSQVHVGSHLVYTDSLGTVATTIEPINKICRFILEMQIVEKIIWTYTCGLVLDYKH